MVSPLHPTLVVPGGFDTRLMLRMWELLDALEARGLLAPDATFEEFEALMARAEVEATGLELPPSSERDPVPAAG